MKRRIAFIVCLLACAAVYAGETSKLLKARLSSGSAAKAGVWLSNFSKAKNYAVDNGLPLIAVWSNGDSCGHCVTFESACNSSYFRKWMASSGMVFYFTHSGESQGAVGGSIFHWCRKNKNTSYPFVRIYWPDGKVDIATVGDTVDGKKDGTTGGKKAVAYFKSKLKNFKPGAVPAAPVIPYYVDFDANGGTGEMSRVSTKVGTTFALPANAFTFPDYSFQGWARTAAGAVAYKDKASVKNLPDRRQVHHRHDRPQGLDAQQEGDRHEVELVHGQVDGHANQGGDVHDQVHEGQVVGDAQGGRGEGLGQAGGRGGA